jgi:RHS repeat-associated protein
VPSSRKIPDFFSLDLYDFPARPYSDQGRWASPDPAGLAAVNPAFPQSWNRYAYVMNNPLGLVDPLGLCPGWGPFVVGSAVLCTSPHPGADTFATSVDPVIDKDCGTDPACFLQGGRPVLSTSQADFRNPIYQPDGGPMQIYINCTEFSSAEDSICSLAPWSQRFAYDGDQQRGINENAKLRVLAGGVIAGAGGIGDPRFIASFYGASVGTALVLGPQSILIGTRYAGNVPLLNSSNYLRFGWSFIRPTGEYVLRIGGDLLGGGHINLWPPSWWF